MIILNRLLYLSLIFAIYFSSCNPSNTSNIKKEKVARVQNKFLFKDDIEDLIPEYNSLKDSSNWMKSYAENWAREQLLLNKAQFNVLSEQLNLEIERKLENHRSSLLIYSYKKEFIKQNLDTLITEGELLSYYDNNKNRILLSYDIVQADFIKLSIDVNDIKTLKKWLESSKLDDRLKLEEFCHKSAKSFLLDSAAWVKVDKLLSLLPMQIDNNSKFVSTNKYVEVVDSINRYLLYITDFRLSGAVPPFIYAKDKIKDMILNQRKLDIVNKLEEDILKDAINQGDYELF